MYKSDWEEWLAEMDPNTGETIWAIYRKQIAPIPAWLKRAHNWAWAIFARLPLPLARWWDRHVLRPLEDRLGRYYTYREAKINYD